jgi:hypothetical protein
MADKPPAMFRTGRPKTEIDSTERLYRRVSPDQWGDPHPEIDALDVPNMSVNRGEPIGDPLWVLLEGDECAEWGIVYFVAGDIPARMPHADGSVYTFRAEHVPLDDNYPHAEVWALIDGTRYAGKKVLFDRDMSLRWRNALLQQTRVFRWPNGAAN